jgi:hypothetical protein
LLPQILAAFLATLELRIQQGIALGTAALFEHFGSFSAGASSHGFGLLNFFGQFGFLSKLASYESYPV